MKRRFDLMCVIKLTTLLLAMLLAFSGCGNGKTTSSAATDTIALQSEQSTDLLESGSNAESSKADTKSSAVKSGSTKGDATVFPANPYENISSVKSKELHILMWRKYTQSEQKLIRDFEQKFGFKIRTTQTTEANYTTKLISMISGNDAPDVVCFSAGQFPAVVLKSMKAMDPKVYKLNDSCWSKPHMDAYKVNGKYYGVAMRGIWSCEDTNYCTYYNPVTLKKCGVTTMPYELYKQGKWNWSAQKDIALKVSSHKEGNTQYSGIAQLSQDLLMLSGGADFVSYNGKQFTNNVKTVNGGSMLVKAWRQMAELNQSKAITSWDIDGFLQGRIGLFNSIIYGLYNESSMFENVSGGVSNLRAVPMAGPDGGTAYTPVRPKVWGTAKSAKNTEGAAYFLRYFLDAKNCDMNSTFYNSQFKEVFNIITAVNNKKCIRYGSGIIDYTTVGTYNTLLNRLTNSTSANIVSTLNANKGTVENNVNKANKALSKKK